MPRLSKRSEHYGKSTEDQIARLRDLDQMSLRICWQNQFGRSAPKHLTRYLLFGILAYKTQADCVGDLDSETLKVLDRLGSRDCRSSSPHFCAPPR
jgi:hypothetical protein